MKTVYVVAWEYRGGGGFDWYENQAAADKAFEEEKKNEADPALARDGWKAKRFEHQTEETDPEKITREIDARSEIF